MKHFDGDLLKRTLKMRKVTQRALSKEICISEKTITSWVHGYGEPSGSTLMDIAGYLKVDPLIFMRTEFKMNKPLVPCRQNGKDCQDRTPGCHNETCPHGWVEYENQLAAYKKAYNTQMLKERSLKEYECKRSIKLRKNSADKK